ncbi:MAG: cell division protein FtsA [Minisyncoccia bacterium]
MGWKSIRRGGMITGIDIGTSSVKIAVGEENGGKISLVHVAKEESGGLRKGAVIDVVEVSRTINRALAEVKKISKAAAKNIYLSIGTAQVKMQMSRGIVAVSRADAEIYQDDMDRAVRASQAVNLPQNRMIIHTLTREFVVDGVGDITDPLGLSGSRLEVQSVIVDAFSPHVKSLIRSVELAGGEISGLVFGPLVAARAALSKRQKDLGVVLVDIGFGTTGMSVYEENKLIGVAKFPVGAGNISNDLGIGLKIPIDAAEEIKLEYGNAVAKEVNSKDLVDIMKLVPEAKGPVSRRFIADIIESRMDEIFDLVNAELKSLGKYAELPGGVVVVGGGAKLPGTTDLAKQEMRLSAQIGSTLSGEWVDEGGTFKEYLEDPEFVGALGLVLWGADNAGWGRGGNSAGSAMRGIKSIFGYFSP